MNIVHIMFATHSQKDYRSDLDKTWHKYGLYPELPINVSFYADIPTESNLKNISFKVS